MLIKITLIIFAALIAGLAACFLIIRGCRKEIKQKSVIIERLNRQVQVQKSNLVYLYKHSEDLNRIKNGMNQMEEDLDNAKTDDEIAAIIDTVISLNNSKLQNSTGGNTGNAATKA